MTYLLSLLGCVLFIVWIFLGSVSAATTEAFCLGKGYAESKTDWKMNGYCVKRDYTGQMYSIPRDKVK